MYLKDLLIQILFDYLLNDSSKAYKLSGSKSVIFTHNLNPLVKLSEYINPNLPVCLDNSWLIASAALLLVNVKASLVVLLIE
ncbi:hypothetical protein ACJA28_03425 [Mesomycoplasma moatsii]|uniref:hypothetical protein n=1 Tax=Mesomycoplasma moatsii TaxID=171287 RepID=UPI003872C090